jgi:hypothetical protein
MGMYGMQLLTVTTPGSHSFSPSSLSISASIVAPMLTSFPSHSCKVRNFQEHITATKINRKPLKDRNVPVEFDLALLWMFFQESLNLGCRRKLLPPRLRQEKQANKFIFTGSECTKFEVMQRPQQGMPHSPRRKLHSLTPCPCLEPHTLSSLRGCESF